jgi:hypothetical protein
LEFQSLIQSKISLAKPLDEIKYVVYVNLHRRHLDEFQHTEVAIKLDKLYRKIARDTSADAPRIQSEFQRAEAAIAQEPELKSSQQLAEDFAVSSSTIERVRTILNQGTQADPISEEQKRDS